MINAVVKPRKDGLYDFAFYDSANGNLLSSSNQGYENAIDAENIARRLAPAGEPMHLAVRHRDGTSTTETVNRVIPALRQAGGLGAGVVAIATERAHQLQKGYTPEHDANHGAEDLVSAAMAYTVQALDRVTVEWLPPDLAGARHRFWPWDWSSFGAADNELQSLAKAGALIAAAYDVATGGAQ